MCCLVDLRPENADSPFRFEPWLGFTKVRRRPKASHITPRIQMNTSKTMTRTLIPQALKKGRQTIRTRHLSTTLQRLYPLMVFIREPRKTC